MADPNLLVGPLVAADPTSIVNAACANKDTIVQVLAWAGGVMPLASLGTWFTAKWGKLPPGLQTLLQVASGNLLHAVLGEPLAQPQMPPPVPPAPQTPTSVVIQPGQPQP